jgi:hypothetical protein
MGFLNTNTATMWKLMRTVRTLEAEWRLVPGGKHGYLGKGRWLKYWVHLGCRISPCYSPFSLGLRFETNEPFISLRFPSHCVIWIYYIYLLTSLTYKMSYWLINICNNVYFFDFQIFFLAAVNRGYWISRYGGTPVPHAFQDTRSGWSPESRPAQLYEFRILYCGTQN